jgi:hypothetical protein
VQGRIENQVGEKGLFEDLVRRRYSSVRVVACFADVWWRADSAFFPMDAYGNGAKSWNDR